jgi:acetylglutamate kinase
MILSGVVNKALAAGLTAAGLPAVGLSGRDGGLVRARLLADLGRVGSPEAVDPRAIRALWEAGLVPVVSPVAGGPGGVSVNVNADEAAFGLARALGAQSLVYLSDVPGVRVGERTVEAIDATEAARLIADGTIAGGMALKVQVALEAVHGGIEEVVVAGKERLEGGFPGTRIVGARVPATAGSRTLDQSA